MASLFVESLCQLGKNTTVDLIAWSLLDPIAALCVTTRDESGRPNHQIAFINNEGELIPNSSIVHEKQATSIEWQPGGRIVGIGFADGAISCYAFDGRNRPILTYSNSSQHGGPITVFRWNPFGRRVVTGDKNGMAVVWTVDARGSLTSTRQYRKKGRITTAIFCVITPRAEITRKADWKQSYSPPFFFGTASGLVVYADDLGHCTEVQTLSSAVDMMLFYEEKSKLIIITRSLYLSQYIVGDDGRVTRGVQMKLSVSGEAAEGGLRSVVWVGRGLLALATHEKFVRFLDLNSDDGYNLSLSLLGQFYEKSDRVVVVSFNVLDRYLSVGTKAGIVSIWKYIGPSREGQDISSSSSDWELQHCSRVGTSVSTITWSSGQGTLAAAVGDGVAIMTEAVLRQGMCGDLTVVQTSAEEVRISMTSQSQGQSQSQSQGSSWVQKTGILVKGMSVGYSCFVVWNGKAARAFRVDATSQKCEVLEPFACSANAAAIAVADSTHINDDAVFVAEQGAVRVVNFTGTEKGRISFTDAEGSPEHVDLNDKFLAVLTNKGVIKVFDVSKPKDPKQVGSAAKFAVADTELSVKQIGVNCRGTRVAILADHVQGALQIRIADARVFVFDRNKGATNVYDFSAQRRSPTNVRWDPNDDRIFVCESINTKRVPATTSAPGTATNGNGNGQSGDADEESKAKSRAAADNTTVEADVENESEITIFFATSEHGILLQDSYPRKYPHGPLLGITVPKVYFRSAAVTPRTEDGEEDNKDGGRGRDDSGENTVFSKVMRDFVGLTDVDDVVRDALLDFSFNLALGKLDEAYRAVRRIDSAGVWENMAQMCVKTRRLDVADVCLGNMGHARGAAALREAKANPNNSAQACLGILAIQLGLLDDAAKLFRETERFDLLNNLFQSAGLWEKAIATATANDRIHLKTTHYHYARHLESIGDIGNAIRHYESSATSRHEVPRMLYTLGRVEELEEYVQQSDDTSLLKWWAAYLESTERFDKARKYYGKAGDFLSLVRIACFKGEYNLAAEIVQEAGDKAAAYHFARQLEVQGQLNDAISYYASSGCFNHAIRLAKGNRLDAELMRFAVKASPSLMLDCAAYYEAKGEIDKAVQLYHKGGDLAKALELVFQAGGDKSGKSAGVFDMVNIIAADLGAETSPQTLARCAEFLMGHKQFEKAIDLYVMAKKYLQAIEMCVVHKVDMTDAMAEKLTPPETMDSNERKDILKDLGTALKKQGNFVLASKKFTQAGDRLRAMKCLLRGGDVKAIIQFASISRTEEIYRLAANYLQQLNWHESADIMKAIITFYTKAKAFENLANFYDSCAQVEIDDYRNYEKAQGAMGEALNCFKKGNVKNCFARQIADMEKRLGIMASFIQARSAVKKDPETMISICTDLLEEPTLDTTVRVGDCLAMMIEYYRKCRKYQDAYKYMQLMANKNIDLKPYIEADIIEEVYKAVGISVAEVRRGSVGSGKGGGGDKSGGAAQGGGGGGGGDDDDEVEDEVEDDLQEEDEEGVGEDLDEAVDDDDDDEEAYQPPPQRGNPRSNRK
eukprot:gene3422-6789_t